MIFFSHSSRIRILKITFALVCSCSEGLINNRKTSSGAILFTDILYSLFKYSNKVLLFSWYSGHRVKKCISSSTSFLQIGQILSSGFLQGLTYRPVSIANLWLLRRSLVSYPVSDVGDLTEIIFTFIIFYCFKLSEGS